MTYAISENAVFWLSETFQRNEFQRWPNGGAIGGRALHFIGDANVGEHRLIVGVTCQRFGSNATTRDRDMRDGLATSVELPPV